MEKLIITACLTGAEVTREQQPNLPLTPDEIAEAAYQCYLAGASMIHVHARDAEGNPTQDYAVYKEIKEKVHAILKLVDLEGKENLMPSDLSGGMQKRVGMARSIVMNPDIILYDEPTAGLDPKNTKNVVELMRKFKDRGHASIFVTHDIPAALDLCDRLMILNEGVIALNITPKEFISSNNPILSKFKTQQGKIHGS